MAPGTVNLAAERHHQGQKGFLVYQFDILVLRGILFKVTTWFQQFKVAHPGKNMEQETQKPSLEPLLVKPCGFGDHLLGQNCVTFPFLNRALERGLESP